tara:strand:- start:1349 stop:2098 length:750 start_codon:yes stop_codon:yes gene_type:complete
MLNDSEYKCFIIHLKRAKKRKTYVDKIISQLSISSEIINAVDGKLLSDNDILKYSSSDPLFQPTYPFGLNNGEIGCFLSFRKAWKKIVDQNLSAGLIFEDDVSLNLDIFNKSLKSALKWIDEYGYIQFQVRDIPKKSILIKTENNVKLFQPFPNLLRCSAQLVSYSTAVKLLKLTKVFDRPVDGFLQLEWNTHIKISTITPSGVKDNTDASGGSNLSIDMPFKRKIRNEWTRLKYRHQIKKYTNKYFKI